MKDNKATAYENGIVKGFNHKELNETKNLLVTVSGGRSSAMVARTIQTSNEYEKFNKLYVFSNTGLERPQTIDFLKNIVNKWDIPLQMIEGVYSEKKGVGVNYKLVEFDNLDMKGTPFKGAIRQVNKGSFYGLPFSKAPYCSDYTKTRPTKRFADEIFGKNNYVKSIGFRKEDVPKRIAYPSLRIDEERIFPLLTDFDKTIGQMDLNKFWNKQPFKLSIHGDLGNCELCWKKGEKTLINNIRYGTRFIDYTRELEKEFGNTMFRENMSIDDLIKEASRNSTIKIEFGKDDENENCFCGI